MTRPSLLRRALTLTAAAGAIALLTAPAIAQVKPMKETYINDQSEIVIIAPSRVYREEVRRSMGVGNVTEVSLSTAVHTYDLDLRYERDVNELQRRIRATAESLCDELDDSTSHPLTSERECVRETVSDAMAQADDLIAYRRG